MKKITTYTKLKKKKWITEKIKHTYTDQYFVSRS